MREGLVDYWREAERFNALELSGGPLNVERLCIFREARPYHPVRLYELFGEHSTLNRFDRRPALRAFHFFVIHSNLDLFTTWA